MICFGLAALAMKNGQAGISRPVMNGMLNTAFPFAALEAILSTYDDPFLWRAALSIVIDDFLQEYSRGSRSKLWGMNRGRLFALAAASPGQMDEGRWFRVSPRISEFQARVRLVGNSAIPR